MPDDIKGLKDAHCSEKSSKSANSQNTVKDMSQRTKTGAQNNYLDIAALIRSIQRSEGTTDCFRRGQTACDHIDCAWRLYCLDVSSRPGSKLWPEV